MTTSRSTTHAATFMALALISQARVGGRVDGGAEVRCLRLLHILR